MSSLIHNLRAAANRLPTRKLPLLAGLAAFAVVTLVLIRLVPGPAPQAQAQVSAVEAPVAVAEAPVALPAAPAEQPALTGQLTLTDFRIVVPPGWERRPDLEEQGPGTKLFLAGPTVGDGQLYLGIDVYTLPHGMKLADFIKRYSSQWAGTAGLSDKPAALCGKPARMLAMSDGRVDKLFLVAVYGDRGYVIGMFGPTGQGTASVKAFQAVVNSFQFYG